LDAYNNFYRFSNLQGFAKTIKWITEKKDLSRGGGSEPGRPKSGGLPGAWLAEMVSRRPIQIGRRGFIFSAALHARTRGSPAG
jgi:hypothetical protein